MSITLGNVLILVIISQLYLPCVIMKNIHVTVNPVLLCALLSPNLHLRDHVQKGGKAMLSCFRDNKVFYYLDEHLSELDIYFHFYHSLC